MDLLKFTILFGVCLLLTVPSGQAEGYDLERIKTNRGRVYHDILIMGADSYGMLFRHRNGIAKVGFESLSMNLRMMYEPTGEEEESFQAAVASEESLSPVSKESGEVALPIPSTLTVRTSIVIPHHRVFSHGKGHASCRQPVHWPSHWTRYHPAIALAVPACRERAIRDFLITTGLVPRPCGVVTYALPRHGPYRFY